MIRTDKTVYRFLLVWQVLCVLAGVVMSVTGIFFSGAVSLSLKVSYACYLVSLGFAVGYLFSGYGKPAARAFKLFGVVFAAAQVVSLAGTGANSSDFVATLLPALALAVSAFLASGKDFGKRKSLLLCGLHLVLVFVSLGFGIIGSLNVFVRCNIVVKAFLSLLYGMMTYAKYLDKAERGTK